jgi:hypothetical protein
MEIVPERVTVTVARLKSVVRPHRRQLQLQRGSTARVLRPHELGEECLIGGDIGEVAAAAQLQSLAQAGLEMAVRRLDAAVLMADTRIVAGRLQAVVVAECPVAGRCVVILTQIAVGCRQPVGAMRRRRPAQLP